MLGRLRDYSGVHMATCAAADAAGRVYFAGRWYRDGKGGGVGWWDPDTETAGGSWEELSNRQVVDCRVVGDGRYLVLSTLSVPDPVRKREYPEKAVLCVIDTRIDPSLIIKRIAPVDGARSTGLIAPAGETRLIGIAPSPERETQWFVYGVDVLTGKVAFIKPIPGLPEQSKLAGVEVLHSYRHELVVAPDGSIWFKHLGALLRIDPSDAEIQVIGKPIMGPEARAGFGSLREDERESLVRMGMIKGDGAPAQFGRMTFAGRDLYLGGTPVLLRLRDVF
jgi:hypothetical protein